MKYLLVFLGCFLFLFCKTTKQSTKITNFNSIQVEYITLNCNYKDIQNRNYLNDSMYFVFTENTFDTFLNSNFCFYKIYNSKKYLLFDTENDFIDNSFKFHFCYSNISKLDSSNNFDYSEIQEKIRIKNEIDIYVPKQKYFENNHFIYEYYQLSKCYPVTEECINAKIMNGHFTSIKVINKVGVIGYKYGLGECSYEITEKSYSLLSSLK